MFKLQANPVLRLAVLACLANSACAPAYRLASGRCPTTSLLLADFTATTVALATSALAYNAQHYTRSFTFAAVGMSVALGANVAEHKCAR